MWAWISLCVIVWAMALRPAATASEGGAVRRQFQLDIAAVELNEMEDRLRQLRHSLADPFHNSNDFHTEVGSFAAWSTLPFRGSWVRGYYTNVLKEPLQQLLDLDQAGYHQEAWEVLFGIMDAWYAARRVVEGCE